MRRPLYDRLNEKIDRSGGLDACWPWTGGTNDLEYGVIGTGDGKKLALAHRVAWEQAHGPIPKGKKVLHHCDNPPCCNPYGDLHLFLGTQKDNMRDKESKRRGNHATGPQNARTVLTDADVQRIRESKSSPAALARELGVSATHVNMIKKGKRRAR